MTSDIENRLINITIGTMLHETALRYPDRLALISESDELTYSQMDEYTDMLGRRLIGLGIKKGDHVGVCCKASIELIMMIYALARIGAICCLLNTGLKKAELFSQLMSGDIRILFVGEGLKHISSEDLAAAENALFTVPLRVCRISDMDNVPPVSVEKLRSLEAAVRPDDTAMILYTSGSTGPAKPVMSSHYSRVNCGRMQAKDLGAMPEDVFLCALPVFHCFSLSANVLAACAAGAALCIPRSHHTGDILEAVQKSRCSIFSAVPAMFHAIIRRNDLDSFDLSSLRTGIIGGSMYPVRLFREVEERLGMKLLSSLGQTEATGGITVASPDDTPEVRSETVGHFMDFVEGRIQDIESGRELPAGIAGEICIRGYNVMQGYYNMPEATAETIDPEGWLHTGDVGFLDGNGYLHMAGRLKDLIIRGGENISPAEIESVFFEDPKVACCKAMAVPDPHYGEEICLFVEPKASALITEGEVRAKVASVLSDYKVPKYVVFIDCIPKTATGKILTGELKRWLPSKS